MTPAQKLIAKYYGIQNVIDAFDTVDAPVLSVVMPTRNCLEYLPMAIKSVQKQGVESFELIIIDDGSNDGSGRYLQLASRCDKRIKVRHLKGVGVAAARNIAIHSARGKWLAFLDADDYWLPGKLLKQINFHQVNQDVVMSFCNYLHFNEAGEDLGDCFAFWPHFNRMNQSQSESDYRRLDRSGLAYIYGENVVGTSTVMINLRALKVLPQFDQSLVSAEDWALWLDVASRGPVGFCTDVDVAYLMRSGSETSRHLARLAALEVILKRYQKSVFKSAMWPVCLGYARLCIGYGEYFRGKNNLSKAIICHTMGYCLAPSWRVLRALLSDIKQLICKANRKMQGDKQRGLQTHS